MPVDHYTPCPGGCDKKIKFCCPDLVGELEKINRMLEGEQYAGCREHVDRLLEKTPDRACLLATKVLLLRASGQLEESKAAVASFIEHHPTNPVALAESAMLAAATEGGSPAIKLLQQAIVASDGKIHGRVWNAMDAVARVLASEENFLAARAVALMQVSIQRDDQRSLELLMELNSQPSVPLVMKTDARLESCPDDAAWKADFDAAVLSANKGHWIEAVEKFAALSEQASDAPSVWRNLATIRGWMADPSGMGEALDKYAALDVPLEDAVEAQALRSLMTEDPLGDQSDVLNLRYTIKDAETVAAALLAAEQTTEIRSDLSSLTGEEGPPPKTGFVLFDGGVAGSTDELTLDSIARVLCQVVVFGKETDREARLEAMAVVGDDADQVKALLSELVGDELDSVVEEEVIESESRTYEILTQRWRLPENCPPDKFRALAEKYLDGALLNQWPDMPLGLLGGKSPREAAGEESLRVKVLAAILVLQHWSDQVGGEFDFNRLRSGLGLPTLEPVEIDGEALMRLPLARLMRVEADKLSDTGVVQAFHRCMAFGVRTALPKFARAMVERPSLSGREERLTALRVLVRLSEDPNQALEYIEQGRQAVQAAGQSCADWDIMELTYRFDQQDGEGVSALLGHIQQEHIQEPGVADTLTRFLMAAGVINPDGSPNLPPGGMDPGGPGGMPGEMGAEPEGLWTPDSQKPEGEGPGLWTPGMD